MLKGANGNPNFAARYNFSKKKFPLGTPRTPIAFAPQTPIARALSRCSGLAISWSYR